jgi:hypothetical protein
MTVGTEIERLIERWIDKRIGNGPDQKACVGSAVREVERQRVKESESQRVSRQRQQ